MSQKIEAPLVVMMCGVAGSGKTTYAKQLEVQGYVRLSIDEEIWASHGRYGIDYPAGEYQQYALSAEAKLRMRLIDLVRSGRSAVVDFSFWQRQRRDEYKQLIERHGGRWRLIYLKVDPEILRARLLIRSQRFDANAAFPITDDILQTYLNVFEEPSGEGEIIVTP